MSKKFHQRIISLTYFEGDLPTFPTDDEARDWFYALGRMVAYGLIREPASEDTVQLTTVQLDRTEITGVFFPKMVAHNLKWEDGSNRYSGSTKAEVDAFVDGLGEKTQPTRPFVMGAVKGHDGKYGFHS